jgi:SAM-dependent methyltransferase
MLPRFFRRVGWGPSGLRAVPPSLASVAELHSKPFQNFMREINAFAAQHDLRQFSDWSKVWEYPWLYYHGLSKVSWRGQHLVDLGSEISPIPWWLASQGASVSLIETDSQWLPHWTALRKQLGLDVRWTIATTELLPLPNDSADAITSFSVVEHQSDKAKAVSEICRVLKPNAPLFISFDICEPSLGMTFPDWNGRALSLNEFENLFWRNPDFGNTEPVHWNLGDIPDFLTWHLRSAPHHNYVVGAAVLIKKSRPVGIE